MTLDVNSARQLPMWLCQEETEYDFLGKKKRNMYINFCKVVQTSLGARELARLLEPDMYPPPELNFSPAKLTFSAMFNSGYISFIFRSSPIISL